MSATKALTKSVNQTATPELRTSTILGSSRRKEALISLVRVHIPQTSPNTIWPFSFLGNLAFLRFWVLILGNFPSEILSKKSETFQFKLKRLPLDQVLTKNFSEKTEMTEMLKSHFGSSPLSNPFGQLFRTIRVGLPKFILGKAETIPETFQAVSRNAETLALQINHLREFDH